MAAASFEEKELRISTKVLVAIVIQTAIIVATAVGFYFALRSDLRDNRTMQDGKNELFDEKFKSIQLENSILTKELEGANLRIEQLRIEIDETFKQKK